MVAILALLPFLVFAQTVSPGQRFILACEQDPRLCAVRTVDAEGKLELPGVGSANVANAAISQLGRILSDLATRVSGRRKVVTATATSPILRSVRISGAVAYPMAINLHRGRRLSELLTEAGVAANADLETIRLIQVSGRTTVVNLLAGNDCDLRPGDQVVVSLAAESADVAIVGAVLRPGSVPWRAGLTLLQALQAAGGLTPHARGDLVTLRRSNGPPEPVGLAAADAIVLRRGDQISVPLVDNPVFITILGDVVRPGLVPYADGTSLQTLLDLAGGLPPSESPRSLAITRFGPPGPRNRKIPLVQALRMTAAELNLTYRDTIEVRREGIR